MIPSLGQFQDDVDSIGRIAAVPTILDVVCRTTGMRFAAVARVTEGRWIACSVLDQIEFGLKPGGELKIETTICNKIRQSREPVVINHVDEDAAWAGHPIPAMYGFQSYISMPIVLIDGTFFGTLCAIDPRPARVDLPETIGMFRLFADLIAKSLEGERKLALSESALLREREDAGLREQFIAVLAHDLRTPMRSISCLMDLLMLGPLTADALSMARIMRGSATRMNQLIENMLDLARGRLTGGLPLHRDAAQSIEPTLRGVVAELLASQPDRVVQTSFALPEPVDCDRPRIAQLFSNLLGNALTYGAPDRPIRVHAAIGGGRFELSVSNAGDPIPPASMERLFQPFFREAGFNREGLGLGLYIAHEIAVAHGGTLSVESTAEETCFTFRMPLG